MQLPFVPTKFVSVQEWKIMSNQQTGQVLIRDESGSEFNLTSEVGTSFGQYILIDTKDSPQSTSRRLQADSEENP